MECCLHSTMYAADVARMVPTKPQLASRHPSASDPITLDLW